MQNLAGIDTFEHINLTQDYIHHDHYKGKGH